MSRKTSIAVAAAFLSLLVIGLLSLFLGFRPSWLPIQRLLARPAIRASFLKDVQFLDEQLSSFSHQNPQSLILPSKLAKRMRALVSDEQSMREAAVACKRLRLVASLDTDWASVYRLESIRLAEKYPYSRELIVLASDAQLQAGRADRALWLLLQSEATVPEALLWYTAIESGIFTQIPANNLDDSPYSLPDALLSIAALSASVQTKQALLRNAAIVFIRKGEASLALQLLRPSELHAKIAVDLTDEQSLRLLAFTEYDYGDTASASVFFELLGSRDEYALAASAAALSTDIQRARMLWQSPVLAADSKSLYNLAQTETLAEPAQLAAKKLYDIFASEMEQAPILYSRFLPQNEALSLLAVYPENPRAALERLSRSNAERSAKDFNGTLWLLIHRFPQSSLLVYNAAEHFYRYSYTAELRQLAEQYLLQRIDTDYLAAFWWGLLSVLDSDYEAATRYFERSRSLQESWQAIANLAGLAEASRDTRKALELFVLASSLSEDVRAKSSLQVRAGKLLLAMGKESDALRSFQYAVDLDPLNHEARLLAKRNMN